MINKDMPKYAREKTLGEKVADGTKYVLKNSWKVLPFGSLFGFLNRKEPGKVPFLRCAGHLIYATVFTLHVLQSIQTDNWTLKQYREAKLEKVAQKQHTNQLNSNWDKLFDYAVDFEDSLRIYEQLDLEKDIQFNEPSLEDKERIVGK